MFIHRRWCETRKAVEVTLGWYEATRHSFVSRSFSGGASLDEVSAAVGHSSPVVTRRYYDHFLRKAFSPALRAGLGLGAPEASSPTTGDPSGIRTRVAGVKGRRPGPD